MSDQATSLEPVSAEHNGIILSGVGVSEESLAETMEARSEPSDDAPADTAPSEVSTPGPADTPEQVAQRARDEQTGRFAKPTRGQKRFDELTKARSEAEAKAAAAEARAAEYEQRLKVLETRPAQPEPTPQAQPTAQADPAEPDFEQYEAQVGEKYPSYAAAINAYNRDFAKYQQTQFDARHRASIEAERASRAFQSHVSSVFDQGRKAFADFDATMARSTVHFPEPIRLRIAQMPDAHAVMYALCKDDALAQRIAAVGDPVQLGWELARVSAPSAVASPASTAQAVSNAPAPYQPVGSGSKTTAPTLDELAAGGDDYDKSGYRERRRQERLGRR